MKWSRLVFWSFVLLLAGGVLAEVHYKQARAEKLFAESVSAARQQANWIQSTIVLFSTTAVPSGLPFEIMLRGAGVDSSTAARVISSVQPVFNLRQLRAGNRLSIGRSVLGELRSINYRIDTDRVLSVSPEGRDFHARIETIPSTIEKKGVGGVIHGSLFESVMSAGEKPELALRLAQIFGYDLDFYTDPRPGDTFRVVVEEKHLATGEDAAYGRILAAEYVNAGHVYRAILFRDVSGHEAYFTPDGKSLRRAFLHSPLQFAAPITSHFSMHRFHPILKEFRPHLGTDYAAPTGTPVQTIGEGRVVSAGRKGGAGNMVEIHHSNGYDTFYMHLSRILVQPGQHVAQGQRIGAVGMTGLATGPHLDFRIENHGQFLNFEKLAPPPAESVSKREWAAFASSRDASLALMPDMQTIMARNSAPPTPNVAVAAPQTHSR